MPEAPRDARLSLAPVSPFAIRCRTLQRARFRLSHTRAELRHEPPFPSIARRLFRIAWPFVAIVALLVLLASESISIVSASRAYIGAESLWSKAQKEAVYSLYRYAQSGSESDFEDYRKAISIPIGDRRARLELEKPQPDIAAAVEGFVAGHNDPDDVDGMIAMFRRFRSISFMSNAITVWSEGDDLLAELETLADELHARIRLEGVSTEKIEPILARIFEVNQTLTPLEVTFSNSLGVVSRRTEQILVAALTVVASLLVVLGIAIAWKILRASSELERQLFAERDRARHAGVDRRRGHHDRRACQRRLSESRRRGSDERACSVGAGHAARRRAAHRPRTESGDGAESARRACGRRVAGNARRRHVARAAEWRADCRRRFGRADS